MNDTHSQMWQTLFGTAWEYLMADTQNISAFILDHRNRSTETDMSFAALSELGHSPSYEELSELTETISADKATSNLRLITAVHNDDITAGFIRLNIDITSELDGTLPLYPLSRLMAKMSKCSAPSLLALIRLSEYGSMRLGQSELSSALSLMTAALPDNSMLSPAADSKYWLFIPSFNGSSSQLLEGLQQTLKNGMAESGFRGRSFTFTAGCAAEDSNPSRRMSTAEFALYDASENGTGFISVYSDDRYEKHKSEYDNMRRLTKLIDNNLFLYHFQPIVSARDGRIVAYEALMRTDKSINMFPLEILGAATKLGRMYDIEKATITNSLRFISDNQELFRDRKLFVNSIPAHILSTADWDSLVQEYGELTEKMVIEMTEQTELDNDRLALIRDRLQRSNIQLAIDDYGTGYSNSSNLLRYNPDYVKIDRSLIENIHTKPSAQKLVSSLIGFIHENGFTALAEGVETIDELTTVMKLGADLIQGYYISKPKPFTLHEISDSLKAEIEDINRRFSADIMKVYRPEENETVELSALALEHYSSIHIENDNVTIIGKKDTRYSMTLTIKEGLSGKLSLRDVCLVSEKDKPCIALGENAHIDLNLHGSNECQFRGIYVPKGTSLHILGSGSMLVHNESTDAYGIGTGIDEVYGEIIVEHSGKLIIESNGENSFGIGGGKSDLGSLIRLLSGDIYISCSGGSCVGIGNANGNSIIDVINCACSIEMNASSSLGIGSFTGKTDISLKNYEVNVKLSGLNLTGIGTPDNGSGRIVMQEGSFNADMHGRTINCIGTRGGNMKCNVSSSNVDLYCEGLSVCGIGDITGSGDVSIKETGLDICFLCNEGLGYGSRNGHTETEHVTQDIRINK